MPNPVPMRVPELLAPAGGPDALRAAVSNGADAVYLGVQDLNARRGAQNFELATLDEQTRYAHLRGARVYLTANVVVLPDEFADALALVSAAWEAGVDAVIVQDLGLMRAIASTMPDVRIHASTQIDAHNSPAVQALASLGARRVTLAREVSVPEIAALARAGAALDPPVEVESFVHGSLCFSHSGQCLFSSMIGGRSANRGMCAQPCRLPYELVGERGVVADTAGRYLLSPADLAGVTLLPRLVSAGVAALKIEGRMKSPEYVATVVRVYRAALDRAAALVASAAPADLDAGTSDPDDAGDAFQVTEAEWDLLSEAFSRGFTEAYLSDVRDDRMMSYARPNNRGVPVGRVVSVEGQEATLSLERAVESGDTLEFWTGAGRFAQAAGRMTVDGRRTSAAPAGTRAQVRLEGSVRAGDRVFRVANAALLEAARRTFTGPAEARPVAAVFSVTLRKGRPASVSVEADGHVATAEGAPVEAARTRAVTAEEVVEHVGRLGGTPYEAVSWRLDLEPDVGIGFSVLHALRREAIDALDAARLAPWADRPRAERPFPPRVRPAGVRTSPVPELVVAVSDAALTNACLAAGADRVLVALTSADHGTELPARTEPLLPRVAHGRELGRQVRLAGEGPVTCGNLGVLTAIAKERAAGQDDAGQDGPAPRAGARIAADWGLNVLNAWAADSLAGLGAGMVWASPELSSRQLAELAATSPVPVGALVHGRVELMVAEHCVLQAAGPCDHRCAKCERRAKRWHLKDRKGYLFPVTTDAAGRAHIYNSVPLDLSRALDQVVATGVSAVRLELHLESARRIADIVHRYRSLLIDAAAGKRMPAEPLAEPSTSGHFFRGVS